MSLLGAIPLPAVIVIGSADPDFNAVALNPPSGPLENSGLQFVGDFGGFNAVPIGPTHFLAAGHIGGQGGLLFRGLSYPTVGGQGIPGTDLVVYQIDPAPNGPFPAFAPLYTRAAGPGTEVGRVITVFGKGLKRGEEVLVEDRLAGWLWGDADFVTRWGVNRVSENFFVNGLGQLLLATFDAGTGLGDFEAHLSQFDSSGPMFVQEAGVWKLAGVHYGVQGPYSTSATGSAAFLATLFDARGLFESDGAGGFFLVTGASSVPSGFGSSSVPDSLSQILAIVGQANPAIDTFAKWRNAVFTAPQLANASLSSPESDPDADGLNNLAEYAFGSAPWAPSPAGAPQVGSVLDGGLTYASISFAKAKSLTDVTYTIQVSADLQNWNGDPGSTVPVSSVDQGDVLRVTVRDTVPLLPGTQRFLRVRVGLP